MTRLASRHFRQCTQSSIFVTLCRSWLSVRFAQHESLFHHMTQDSSRRFLLCASHDSGSSRQSALICLVNSKLVVSSWTREMCLPLSRLQYFVSLAGQVCVSRSARKESPPAWLQSGSVLSNKRSPGKVTTLSNALTNKLSAKKRTPMLF